MSMCFRVLVCIFIQGWLVSKNRRVLVFNDQHMPFHDPYALNVSLMAAKDIGVTEIYINGDLLDFYSINMHQKNKHPDVMENLESELNAGKEFLEKLRGYFPKVKIHYIFGNHEHRLERFIISECKSFYNLLKLEDQMELKRLNVTYQYYNDYLEICKGLMIQHSPPSYGVNGARTSLLMKHDTSFIFGCTHRKQQAAITTATGRVVQVWFNGWMGSTTLTDEHKRVFAYTKGHTNWQQCFSIVDIIGDKFFVHQCDIIDGSTSLDGSFYQAKKKDLIF